MSVNFVFKQIQTTNILRNEATIPRRSEPYMPWWNIMNAVISSMTQTFKWRR